MAWNSLIESLRSSLTAQGLYQPDARWVLGASGGPDSTLLLHAMSELAGGPETQWTVHVAHLHHGLRASEADEDEQFVEKLAAERGLQFHSERINLAEHPGGANEEIARQRRYEFLERISLKTGCDCVAVAHHADDEAETVLHRICRGTGLRGLAGMRPVRPIQPGSRVRLVRPFLHLRRVEIETLCAQRGIAFRTDSTNLKLEFTRGRIRNLILPTLREQINPNITDALLRLSEQARWLGTYLEDAAARTFDSLVVNEGPRQVALNIRALLGKQRIIQAEVIRRALSLVMVGESDMGFGHVEAVLRLAADRGSGKVLHLPGSVLVRKVYERLEFRPLTEPEDAPAEFAPVFVNCPGVTDLSVLGAELMADLSPVDASTIAQLRANANPYEEWLDLERIQFPLLVRGRREGDRFWPLGAPGTKNVGDFFSDEKVEPALRARIGILCDRAGPLWIMPLRIDERAKLRATTTRAVRLVLKTHPRASGA